MNVFPHQNIYQRIYMDRKINFAKAINEATELSMKKFSNVFIFGLGVPDPKGIFGTTTGLQKKFGKNRVFDMPLAENGMTGVAIGAALNGYRPIITHQRIEFALLSIEQIINQAAKWNYMTAGKQQVPIVIRMIVGRGWGQGPQHSQNLESLFAHIPGLKVVMPFSPKDAKGLLISSIEDNNPVVFIEHRWLHSIQQRVPKIYYKTPIGKARLITRGKNISFLSYSFGIFECLKAAKILKKKYNIFAEVVDLRTIRPIDKKTILNSVKKTKKAIVVDNSWKSFGVSSEVLSIIYEGLGKRYLNSVVRVGNVEVPCPSTRALAKDYYSNYINIINETLKMFKIKNKFIAENSLLNDVPDTNFTGPF